MAPLLTLFIIFKICHCEWRTTLFVFTNLFGKEVCWHHAFFLSIFNWGVVAFQWCRRKIIIFLVYLQLCTHCTNNNLIFFFITFKNFNGVYIFIGLLLWKMYLFLLDTSAVQCFQVWGDVSQWLINYSHGNNTSHYLLLIAHCLMISVPYPSSCGGIWPSAKKN